MDKFLKLRLQGDFSINAEQIKIIEAQGNTVGIFVKNKKEPFMSLPFTSEEESKKAEEILNIQWKKVI